MNTDDKKVNDEELVSNVCDALDDSVNRLDAETSQRIVAARQQALVKTSKKFSMPKLLTTVATACSILIAVIVVTTQLNKPAETGVIELAGTQDTIELYEELEFYTWLEEEDVTS
ncbi:MAG: DUF3619 family protein [Gammaproteobacteria bacterium]